MPTFETLFEQYTNGTGAVQSRAAESIVSFPDAVPFLLDRLCGDTTRAALSLLSRCAKKRQHRAQLQVIDPSLFLPYLADADAKVRKNAAVLIGSLENEAYVPALIHALERETQQYVRPSLILALGAIGGTQARNALASLAPAEGDGKHAQEQQSALQKAQSRIDPHKQRIFKSFVSEAEVWLAPVSGLAESLMREGADKGIALAQAGGYLAHRTSDYGSLFQLRGFYEALLPVADNIPVDPAAFAKVLSDQRVYDRLDAMHGGNGPFGLRLELRAGTDRGKFAGEFFRLLPESQFVNAPSSYDVELRAVEKEGRATLMLRLYGFDDTRFAYRTEAVSASMHPAAAAAILYEHRDLMKPSHDVLDPFCGAGTLLAERSKIMGARTYTGLDISPAAWRIARENLANANLHAKVYNRDCRGFAREQKVHEILCNLPFGHRVGNHEDNRKLYGDILAEWPSLLHEGGFILAVTNDKQLFERLALRNGYVIARRTTFAYGGLSPTCFLLQLRQ